MNDDTIFAPATAAGPAALAIVRLSGPRSHEWTAALAGRPPAWLRHGQLRRAALRDEAGSLLDQAMVVAFHAPRSATGEHTAELHLHGSPAVVEAVCDALRRQGARPAGPGEFSRRAVLAGKLSLLQAEATADLISSRAEQARQAALAALDGRLQAALEALRAPAIAALAELEARLDFATEDDVSDLPRAAMAASLRAQAEGLLRLASSADAARLRLHGARVVLHGAPNAGKSTLLNALCGAERALVHATPGTTRDLVEATVRWAGLEVTLVDTAGVRAGDGAAVGEVEAAGIARGLQALAGADVVLWLRDAAAEAPAAPMAPDVREGCALLRLWSRADLAHGPAPADVDLCVQRDDDASVAAVRDAVERTLRRRLGGSDDLALLRSRHAEALRAAAEANVRAAAALDDDLPLELAAADLRDGLDALDELIGHVAADDVLDVVFSTFCIGK